jgi:UDP-glucose 4-epimerase
MNTASYKGKRVLITGGLGFIGSNLARRLVHAGAKVTLVDSLIPSYGGNLFNISDIKEQLTCNISDVRDPHSMAYLVQDQDFLFNLAGQTTGYLGSMQVGKSVYQISICQYPSALWQA